MYKLSLTDPNGAPLLNLNLVIYPSEKNGSNYSILLSRDCDEAFDKIKNEIIVAEGLG